jgi:hypothetical protein
LQPRGVPEEPENLVQTYVRLSRYGSANAGALRLSPENKVQAFSFRPVHRVGPDGQLRFEYVAEMMQKRDKVPLDPNDPKSPVFTFRGGTTLVLDSAGNVRYAIAKPMDDDRLNAQRDYYGRLETGFAPAAYRGFSTDVFEMPFAAIHRGY